MKTVQLSDSEIAILSEALRTWRDNQDDDLAELMGSSDPRDVEYAKDKLEDIRAAENLMERL